MSGKLFIKTHGCQMNEYDSAKMADVLAASHGLELTQDESEADEYSVIYLCDTDYAANGAAGFFEKLLAEGGVEIPEFLSTHPSSENRVAEINAEAEARDCAIDPNEAQGLASKIARAIEVAVAQPVLLCTPGLRPHLWRLFSRVLPQVGVLSHNEVPAHVRVAPIAVLD